MLITPHFSLAELTVTSTGLANVPNPEQLCALRATCSAVLEPWRSRVGRLRVSSGFRSSAVNDAVGGSANSMHLLGEAVDVVPLDTPRIEAWLVLLDMIEHGLPVDQAVIYRSTRHVHVAHTARRVARGSLLVKEGARYIPWHQWQRDGYPPLP